ncbi:MAG TPA: hypothetical protein VK895_03130 [Jiangellaceae bacterium]|nr:hypothetical protein [Jiangellaceae bacterium]
MFSSDEQWWADRGVRSGEPSTFSLAVESPSGPAPRRVALGIYQDVPWDEYPFPPRPDVLPKLSPEFADFATVHLTSDPRNPNLAKELILEYEAFHLLMDAQTPGILHLRLNGVEADPIYFWDYGYHPNRCLTFSRAVSLGCRFPTKRRSGSRCRQRASAAPGRST